MKIWFVKIGEPLPTEQGARLLRTGLFAQYLAQKGHTVTWFTETFSHARKKHLYNKSQDIVCQNVNLCLIKVPGYKKNISLARFKHHSVFASGFLKKARRFSEKPDIIICSLPTIENAFAVCQFARENNIKFCLDIRDSWPDDMVSVVPKCLQIIAKLCLYPLYRKMSLVCREANFLMACSNSLLNYGLSFASRQKTKNDYLMPLGYPSSDIFKTDLQKSLRYWSDLGVKEDHFIICFFGTLSRFRNLKTVIEAIKQNFSMLPIQLVICGEGDLFEQYKAQAKGISSIIFPGWINAQQIQALMLISNVGLCPYAKGWRNDFPNKYFEYFSAGLPVLSSVLGEIQTFIDDYNLGLTYDPDSISSFSIALKQLYENQDKAKEMGDNALVQFNKRFRQDRVFENAEKFLKTYLQVSDTDKDLSSI